MSTCGLKKMALLLTFWVALQSQALRAQSPPYITGNIVSGTNLIVTSNTDIYGNTLSMGSQAGTSNTPGWETVYIDGTNSAVYFQAARPGNEWYWQQNGNTSLQPQMTLDSSGNLVLYSNGTNEITLTPAVTGTSTFSSSVIIDGTNNTMPHQILTSSNSVLTEGLADNRYVLDSSSIIATGNSTVGNYSTDSVAMGNSTVGTNSWSSLATGNSTVGTWSADSVAMGNSTVGNYSTDSVAMGNSTVGAYSNYALALEGSTASQSNAVAIGSASATGINSTAIAGSSASAYGALSIGYGSSASAYYSMVIGYNSSANCNFSTASGFYNNANNYFATASGTYTSASGYFSASAGVGTLAQSYDSFVIGVGNVGGGNSGTWVPTDPLFEVGNGNTNISLAQDGRSYWSDYGGPPIFSSTNNFGNPVATGPSDAFVVYKNGNAVVQGTLTAGGAISTTNAISAGSISTSSNIVANGVVRCLPGGDLSMGSYTAGTAP